MSRKIIDHDAGDDLATGQVLVYNATTGNWAPADQSGGGALTIPLLLTSGMSADLVASLGVEGDPAALGFHADGSLRAAHGYMLIPDAAQSPGSLGLYPINDEPAAYLNIYDSGHLPTDSAGGATGGGAAPFTEIGPGFTHMGNRGEDPPGVFPASSYTVDITHTAVNGERFVSLRLVAENSLGGEEPTSEAIRLFAAHRDFAIWWDHRFVWDGVGTQTLKPTNVDGVLEIVENGGGLRLHNDDGSQIKTVRLNHAGTALEVV